ncbi:MITOCHONDRIAL RIBONUCLEASE P PROTEIN 3 [Phytophthora cinnamomi]|uniref:MITOCHONDRIAL RIBONUCLEASE P PROTEIN 3 n=1 Tax=Phytophthora cinnamomi TaxID=4785 RepID=UPI00355A2367|nr:MITOCHONDRIAL RIBONUCLEASE P PROTEIN 3 [Phytophthora cinnamomi]
MQRLSRALRTAAGRRAGVTASPCVSSRCVAAFAASNGPVLAANRRFLSLPAAQTAAGFERCARRRATKLRAATADASAQEAPSAVARQKQPKDWKRRLNVHHCVVQQQMPLPDVLPLVQEEVRGKTLSASVTRQAVDSLYFHCAQQAERKALSEAFRLQLLQYFDRELFTWDEQPFVLGRSLNEAVFGSVIKLHLAAGDTEAAWKLISKLISKLRAAVRARNGQAQEPPKLHFRTVSPLLEHECRHGQFESAYSRWQQLKQHDVEWTSAMEDVLVQMVIACVKNDEQQLNEYTEMPESEANESHFHAQMASLLHDLQIACREVSPSNAQRLLHAFRGAGYVVESVPSDAHMRTNCPCCGHALSKQGMTEQERAYMLSAIESRRSRMIPQNTVQEYLEPFRKWLTLRHENFQLQNLAADLKDGRPLHYVLDGPNIAYINQNFEAGTYRLDHVDAIAKELQEQGHLVSITMPAAYLAEKFVVRIRTKQNKAMRRQGKFITRERTPKEKAILARWKEEDMIFSCRTDFLSDDLFWLYASVLMGREGRVVTNDQGRDHVFALLNGHTSTSDPARPQKNGKKSPADAEADASSEGSRAPSISMDLIARWKDMTTVNIGIKHEEIAYNAAASDNLTAPIPIESIRLQHPEPFSRVPQVTAPQHFHFPIAEQANQNEHPNQVMTQRKRTRWLCVHRKDAIN